jgi:P27 family predicted phage terminase small subunit
VDEARVGSAIDVAAKFPPPVWLGDDAAAVWNEVVPELVEIGLVRSIDVTALEALCEAVAMARAAKAMIDDEGFVARGDRGSVVHPAYRVWRDSWSLAVKLAGEYGLTAVGRLRVGAAVLHQRSLADELREFLDEPDDRDVIEATPVTEVVAELDAEVEG